MALIVLFPGYFFLFVCNRQEEITRKQHNQFSHDAAQIYQEQEPIIIRSCQELSIYLSFHTAAPSFEYYVQLPCQCKNKRKIVGDKKCNSET